jgi:chemotaxis protein MotB
VAGGHHGGAWKVAYADFVTAMMAFFLLMWLLGATTEKQRKGIADYFTPTLVKIKQGAAGSNGLLHGSSLTDVDDYPHRAGQTGTRAMTIPRDATGGPKEGAAEIKRAASVHSKIVQRSRPHRQAEEAGASSRSRKRPKASASTWWTTPISRCSAWAPRSSPRCGAIAARWAARCATSRAR